MSSNSEKMMRESYERDRIDSGSTYTFDGESAFKYIPTTVDDLNLIYKKTYVSVVIPAINEEQNLPYVLPKIPKECEIIMVDGHSTDKTLELAKKIRPDIRVLLQPGKGKGDAMRYGFKHANGDIIVTFDADGSFNSNEITDLVNHLLNGYDMVKGSRFLPGGNTEDMPWFRRFGNRILTNLANILLGTKYTDLVYGFHAFKRKALDKLNLESDGFEIDTELYIKAKTAGLKVKEIPSFENKRFFGQGNLKSLKDGWRILKIIVTVFFLKSIFK